MISIVDSKYLCVTTNFGICKYGIALLGTTYTEAYIYRSLFLCGQAIREILGGLQENFEKWLL